MRPLTPVLFVVLPLYKLAWVMMLGLLPYVCEHPVVFSELANYYACGALSEKSWTIQKCLPLPALWMPSQFVNLMDPSAVTKLPFTCHYVRGRLVKMDDDWVLCWKRTVPFPLMLSFALTFCAVCSCSMPSPVMCQEYHSGDRLEPRTLWRGK